MIAASFLDYADVLAWPIVAITWAVCFVYVMRSVKS